MRSTRHALWLAAMTVSCARVAHADVHDSFHCGVAQHMRCAVK